LDEGDRREISVLVEGIADQLGAYPFGATGYSGRQIR
jgi:hypothetical protein